MRGTAVLPQMQTYAAPTIDPNYGRSNMCGTVVAFVFLLVYLGLLLWALALDVVVFGDYYSQLYYSERDFAWLSLHRLKIAVSAAQFGGNQLTIPMSDWSSSTSTLALSGLSGPFRVGIAMIWLQIVIAVFVSGLQMLRFSKSSLSSRATKCMRFTTATLVLLSVVPLIVGVSVVLKAVGDNAYALHIALAAYGGFSSGPVYASVYADWHVTWQYGVCHMLLFVMVGINIAFSIRTYAGRQCGSCCCCGCCVCAYADDAKLLSTSEMPADDRSANYSIDPAVGSPMPGR